MDTVYIDKNFAKWEDNISQMMYHSIISLMFAGEATEGLKIGDFGGANGILRKYLCDNEYVTIDKSQDNNPDICDNILTHTGSYDLIICRYVIHYLNDNEVTLFFQHLRQTYKGKTLLLVNFFNNGKDLKKKKKVASYQEEEKTKVFRNFNQFKALIKPSRCQVKAKVQLKINKDFYKNRLPKLWANTR
jgi:hypothetical protein